jgi:hypothetical protein
MALREMDGGGRLREVLSLPHLDDFERTWLAISTADRAAIEAEINSRLDHLVTSPDLCLSEIPSDAGVGRRIVAANHVFERFVGSNGEAREVHAAICEQNGVPPCRH